MVPLGNSWVSGVKEWTNAERQAFAHDLTNPQVFAVTDNVNQSKTDGAPDEWRPALESYRCEYSTDWIEVKRHYELTITTEDKAALEDMLTSC